MGTFLESRAREADNKQQQAKQLTEQAEDFSNQLTDSQRQALIHNAGELATQAQQIAKDWGAGGTYRQITTALMAAAGGNLSASNQLFMQSAVVNYLQQQGAGYLGQLVSEGSLKEGTPLHATLHGLIAATGAAACGQAALSSAAGAAASSLLTQLFSDSHPEETQGEQLAKRNLITSLVTGIATMTSDLNPAAASSAASAATDNNWLATQQMAQAKREYQQANNPLEKIEVIGKWGCIGIGQYHLTKDGFEKGLLEGGCDDIVGLVMFFKDFSNNLKGIQQLIASPEVRKQAGEHLCSELEYKVERINSVLTTGGLDNAYQLGKDLGELTWQVSSVVTSAYGVAKGGVALGSIGLKVGQQGIKVVKALHAMDAGVALRKAGETAAHLSKNITSSTANGVRKVVSVVKKGVQTGTTDTAASQANKFGKSAASAERATQHTTEIVKFSVENLVASAKKPINEQGLSAAARAWEKHSMRQGSAFKKLKGNPYQKNLVANNFVHEVLTNKNTIRTNLSRGGIEYRLPDGRGIRYNEDSLFSGFLDPKRPMK